MQPDAIDYINHELAVLLQHNPPPRSPDAEASHLCPELTAPQTFYDKHLDEKFVLKRVETLPLAVHLSRAANRASQSLKDKKIPLPTHHVNDFFPSQDYRAGHEPNTSITDARSLAEVYQHTTALYSSVVASTLLFHFRAPGWYTVLIWKQVTPGGVGTLHAFTERYALQIKDMDKVTRKIQESMEEETRATLRRLQLRHPNLAYWEIFAISREAEDVLRDMNGIASAGPFDYQICRTKGYLTPLAIATCTPDASITSWGVSLSSRPGKSASDEAAPMEDTTTTKASTSEGRRSLRSSTLPHTHDRLRTEGAKKIRLKSRKKVVESLNDNGPRWPIVTTPARSDGYSMANLFLQRAWAQSVEHDTTYIIFNCGNFERIGFRHRSTQTLFLSDLIDVPHCKSPGYTKIHIGLYISILEDAIDRTEQQYKQEEMLRSNNRKRRRDPVALPSNKRYRTRAMVVQELLDAKERQKNLKIVKEEADKRSLALLELRYAIYNSPAPASFLRVHSIGKATYTPHEYLSIVLTSRIASGTTGIAHGANLELLASDGNIRRLEVVVKLAFTPEQTQRLRHEFSIYGHLASRGVVEGVSSIFGLFEDLESDAIALVMSHVGTALVTRLPDPRSYRLTISETAQASYLRVLSTIHAAGVRHRDIRPENLMLSDDDQVAIIDFDMAELGPSDGAKRREMRHMEDLLHGSYRPPNEFPSAATTPERPVAVRPRTVLESLDEDEDEESE